MSDLIEKSDGSFRSDAPIMSDAPITPDQYDRDQRDQHDQYDLQDQHDLQDQQDQHQQDQHDSYHEYKKETIKIPKLPANKAKSNKAKNTKTVIPNQLKPVSIRLRNITSIKCKLFELDYPLDFDSQNKDHITVMEVLVNIPIIWYKYPFQYAGNIDVNQVLGESNVLHTCIRRMQKEMLPVFSNTTDYEKFCQSYVPHYSVNQVKTFLTPYVCDMKVSRELLKKFRIDSYSPENLEWSLAELSEEHKKLYKTEYALELIPERCIKEKSNNVYLGLEITSWGYNNKYHSKQHKWTCGQTLCVMMGWFLPNDKFIGYFDFNDGVNEYIGIGYFIYTRKWVKVPIIVNMFVYNGIHIEGKQADSDNNDRNEYRNIKKAPEQLDTKEKQESPALVDYVIPYHVSGWVDEQFRPHNEDCPDQLTYVTDELRVLSGIFSHGMFKPRVYYNKELANVYC